LQIVTAGHPKLGALLTVLKEVIIILLAANIIKNAKSNASVMAIIFHLHYLLTPHRINNRPLNEPVIRHELFLTGKANGDMTRGEKTLAFAGEISPSTENFSETPLDQFLSNVRRRLLTVLISAFS